ncbi:MAG: endonuclease/exonuclease/phosphatase family protein, partial [Bacteroidota bacterium]
LTWFFIDRKFSLVPLAGLLISLAKLPLVLQPGFATEKEIVASRPTQTTLRVLSFNVRLFDLYNWTDSEKTRQRIFSTIEELNPDIICFQEFFSSNHRNLDNIKAIKQMARMNYHHAEFSITRLISDQYGIATFSKFPIIGKGIIKQEKKSTNLAMYTDVLIGAGDTVRVFNCHLQSVRFKADDYAFIEDPVNNPGPLGKLNKTIAMLRLLKKAYTYRAHQAEVIATKISETTTPLLVCGDFNDTPISFTYRTISNGLKDAFMEDGKGIGATYAGPIPGLRIDYVLYNDDFELESYQTPKRRLSDHLPLVADFKLKQ